MEESVVLDHSVSQLSENVKLREWREGDGFMSKDMWV